MNALLQLIIAGVAAGSIYGLIALGFLVINHASGIVNFAQGNILMMGAVSSYMFVMVLGWSYLVAVPLVVVVSVLIALVFDQGLVKPLQSRGAPTMSIVVATLIFGLLLAEVAALVAGDERRGVAAPIPNDPIKIGELSTRPQILFTVVIAWLIVALVGWFFKKTLLGLALKSVGINRTGAAVSGVPVKRMVVLSFLISFAITGIAGLLIAPILGAGPRMGLDLGVKGFAAAVVGGFGNVNHAMVAGVVIGVLETLSSYFLSSTYSSAIAYGVLLVALFVQPAREWLKNRPQGAVA